ncbi:hypothetical protein CVT24_002923 [Panaeolus cyanescens]|uniref:F-box domain-containing protein n=1 Tax=Panaeolus cyanescens TaxID=181874 RepID=A0A409WT47_9AGAR|nr:hypothetical protein CVT24_002923 [Panaeolus cyanescens]
MYHQPTDNIPTLIDLEAGESAFPFEIFEIIINMVAQSTTEAHLEHQQSQGFRQSDLISLSLVSKGFHDICQPHIFRHVVIGADNPIPRLRELAIMTKENPTLTAFIHSLTYDELSLTKQDLIEAASNDPFDVLITLPAINHLSINGDIYNCRHYHGYVEYSKEMHRYPFPPSYLVSSTLTSLRLNQTKQIDILMAMLCLPRLERLELRKCIWWDSEGSQLRIPCGGFKLKTIVASISGIHCSFPASLAFELTLHSPDLTVLDLEACDLGVPLWDYCSNLLMGKSGTTPFQRLQSLKFAGPINWKSLIRFAVKANIKAFPAVKRLHISIFNNSEIFSGPNTIFGHLELVEELEIHAAGSKFGHEDDDYKLDIRTLNLQHCFQMSARTLKNIVLHRSLMHHEQPVEQMHAVVEVLCNALQSVSHDNVIESIELAIDIDTTEHILPNDFAFWKPFDLLLMADHGAAFPRLSSVKIKLVFRQPAVMDQEKLTQQDYENSVKSCLGGLLSSPKINMACDVKVTSGNITGVISSV